MKKIITFILALASLLPSPAFAAKIRANIGPDRSVNLMQEVNIYATNSFLAGSDPSEVDYFWELKTSPEGYIGATKKEGKGKTSFSFKPNIKGTYLVMLEIYDPNHDEITTDFTIITVKSFEEMFTDLPVYHWARKHFYHLVSSGVMEGYPDNTIHPDAIVTRAEFLAMCFRAYEVAKGIRLEDIEIDNKDIYFGDVDRSHWFYDEVVVGIDKEVIEGYPNGTFQPLKNVNRVEALKVALRFTQIPIVANQTTLSQLKVNPTDWRARYISTAYRKGLLGPDTNAYVRNYEPMTRADAAALIDRIFLNPDQNYDLVIMDKIETSNLSSLK